MSRMAARESSSGRTGSHVLGDDSAIRLAELSRRHRLRCAAELHLHLHAASAVGCSGWPWRRTHSTSQPATLLRPLTSHRLVECPPGSRWRCRPAVAIRHNKAARYPRKAEQVHVRPQHLHIFAMSCREHPPPAAAYTCCPPRPGLTGNRQWLHRSAAWLRPTGPLPACAVTQRSKRSCGRAVQHSAQ